MTAEWREKTLRELCVVEKRQGRHRGLPYVGLEDIEPHTARYIGSSTTTEVGGTSFRFTREHLLYGRLRPYLNKVLTPTFDGHCSTEIFPLRPGPDLSRQFLKYWLMQPEIVARIDATCTGARMPRADVDAILNFEIPLPSLLEQNRIVGILDEAFEGIATARANAERNFQNAHALFERTLQSAFDGYRERSRLSDLASDITDGDHSPPPKSPSGVPFITISDIVKRTREIDLSNTFTVPLEYFRNLKPNKRPRPGDVLYTVTGATLGIPVLVRQEVDFCFQRHIGLIRPKPTTDSMWLSYALLAPQTFEQATRGATGAAQKTVSLSVLRSLEVPRISLAEQRAVGTMLHGFETETRRLESLYQRKLAALDELKRSILHQAFTGAL